MCRTPLPGAPETKTAENAVRGKRGSACFLIFGGTTEGRLIAEFCAQNEVPAVVCVATQTGEDLIGARDGLRIHVGTLQAEEMRNLISGGNYRLVIDATHPYASEATKNIREACQKTGVPYLRVRRESCPIEGPSVDSLEEMIAFVTEETGRTRAGVLSTLGGKSLEALTAVPDFREHVWVRVLPSDAVLKKALSLGYPRDHIILGKGPFSADENIADLKKSGAALLLTKESGAAGGYPEKAAAAKACGVKMLTLRRAAEEGVSMQEAMERIRKLR